MLQTFIPLLCSLAPPTPPPSPTPPSVLLGFFTPVSLFPLFSVVLACLPSHSSSVVPSSLSSCRRGTQPSVKRGNLIASVAFAAFTPTVCTALKVKSLQWWACARQADHRRPHPDPTHCRGGARCPGDMCISKQRCADLQQQKVPQYFSVLQFDSSPFLSSSLST